MSLFRIKLFFTTNFFVLSLLIFVGCAPTAEPVDDGNPDDTGVDTGTGTGTGNDTGIDIGSDTGSDTESDTESDTGSDTGSDSDTGDDTGSDSGADTGSDTGSDTRSDTGGDTGSDTGVDTGSETDTGEDTSECTVETTEADCGTGLYCVEGVCCDSPCDGGCRICNLPTSKGVCVTAPQSTTCREQAGICDAVESCDGVDTECPPDKKLRGPVCREKVHDICDIAELCDGVSDDCPPDEAYPAGTACGDSATSDCDKPDSCDGKGDCSKNWEPNNTLCGAMEAITEYRCSDTDCEANPQSRVTGESCQEGICENITDPPWQDVDDCNEAQICQADSTGSSCVDCNTQPADSCDLNTAIHWESTGLCDASGDALTCAYAFEEEVCVEPNDNCIQGECMPFTCVPAEKDAAYDWEAGDNVNDLVYDAEEGWALNGGWRGVEEGESHHPLQWNDYFVKIDFENDTDTSAPLVPDAAVDTLVSPVYELIACTEVTVAFEFAYYDNQTVCSPLTHVDLECGSIEDNVWTTHSVLWSYEETISSINFETVLPIDATPCASALKRTQFRFVVYGDCPGAIQFVAVDDFVVSVTE